MKTISIIRIKFKNIWTLGLLLLLATTFLSCNKEDDPEIEASLLTDSSQELVLGKWFVELAQSDIPGHCLEQYYLDFKSDEVRNVGALGLIHEQTTNLDMGIPLTKICELPDESTHGYSWAGDQDLNVMIDSREARLSIIMISNNLLILNNETTGRMLVLKRKL